MRTTPVTSLYWQHTGIQGMLYKDSKYHINYYDFVMYIKVKKINVHCFWIRFFFLCYLLLNIKKKNLTVKWMLYIYYIPIYYKPYIKKDFSKANNKSLYFVFVLMALQTSECKENKENKTDIYKILHCVLESKGCAESELIWRRFALLNLCYNKLSRLKSECWDDCAVQSVVLQLT